MKWPQRSKLNLLQGDSDIKEETTQFSKQHNRVATVIQDDKRVKKRGFEHQSVTPKLKENL